MVSGENIITLNMKKDDGTEKNYKIVITKKTDENAENAESTETVENIQNTKPEENKSSNTANIIAVESLICVAVVRKFKGKRSK